MRTYLHEAVTLSGRHISLMRAVIREDMSMSMADELVSDIKRAIEYLDTHYVFTQSQVSTALCPREQEPRPAAGQWMQLIAMWGVSACVSRAVC